MFRRKRGHVDCYEVFICYVFINLYKLKTTSQHLNICSFFLFDPVKKNRNIRKNVYNKWEHLKNNNFH
jgi:hypothetical protein